MTVRGRAGRHREERGSASLWLLTVGMSLVLLAVVTAMAGGVIVARHRARNAADAGALAGALTAVEGEAAACAAAARLVMENGAHLVTCTVSGLDVTVTVRTRTLAGHAAVAAARAGPPRPG